MYSKVRQTTRRFGSKAHRNICTGAVVTASATEPGRMLIQKTRRSVSTILPEVMFFTQPENHSVSANIGERRRTSANIAVKIQKVGFRIAEGQQMDARRIPSWSLIHHHTWRDIHPIRMLGVLAAKRLASWGITIESVCAGMSQVTHHKC